MKKFICLLVSFTVLFGVLAFGVPTEHEADNQWTLFVDNIELETTSLDGYVLFPLRAILESLGSTVTWEEGRRYVYRGGGDFWGGDTRHIVFDFAGEEYAIRVNQSNPASSSPEFVGIRFMKAENRHNSGGSYWLNLGPRTENPMRTGFAAIVNNRAYLVGITGRRLFEELGCRVYIDTENRILRIYSPDFVSYGE